MEKVRIEKEITPIRITPLALAKELFSADLKEYQHYDMVVDNGLSGAGIYIVRLDNNKYCLCMLKDIRGRHFDRYMFLEN